MEYELDYEKPEFQEDLIALMGKAAIVKIYGWSRAKDQLSVRELIKQHNYAVEAYTVLNFAKLIAPLPKVSP
jgi:hypothetical protein